MNLPTILVGLVLLALLGLAVRYLMKNGTCAGCSKKGGCHSAGSVKTSQESCGQNCSACAYHELEQQAAQRHAGKQ